MLYQRDCCTAGGAGAVRRSRCSALCVSEHCAGFTALGWRGGVVFHCVGVERGG